MKKLALTLLFLIATHTGYSMQRLAEKLAQSNLKSVAKKGFSGIMTGLHWTIAAGTIPITYFMVYRYDSFNRIPMDENNRTTDFIRSEFAKHNTPIKHIMLDVSTPQRCGVTFNSTFVIGRQIYNQINMANFTDDKEELMKWRGTLNHESNHLSSNDPIGRCAAILASPFITHGMMKKINDTITPSSMKINSYRARECIKIPSAFGKLILSSGLIAAFGRYREQRADNNIENNIDVLKGFKAFLAEDIIQEKEYYEKGSPLFRLWKKYTASHPSTEKRIALLDQRIIKLEKSE